MQSKDSVKLEHVLYVLQRELKNAKALYEENKSLGFTANMVEAEGRVRGLTHVNETIELDLKEYFTED